MDEQIALAIVVLWQSGHFNTHDIARITGEPEPAVHGLINASRQIGKTGKVHLELVP